MSAVLRLCVNALVHLIQFKKQDINIECSQFILVTYIQYSSSFLQVRKTNHNKGDDKIVCISERCHNTTVLAESVNSNPIKLLVPFEFFPCTLQFIETVTSAVLLDAGEQNTFKCFMYKKHSDIQRLKWYLSNIYTSSRQDRDLTHKTTGNEMQVWTFKPSKILCRYLTIFKK